MTPYRRLAYASRLTRTVAAAVAVGLLAAGCGGASGTPTPGAKPGTEPGAPVAITLYSGQHPETTGALVAAFEKATGITVHVRDDDEDVLANQIVEEGTGSPADVVYTENSQALQFLQGKGPAGAGRPVYIGESPVPVTVRPPATGSASRPGSAGIVYNTKLVAASQLPTSVMDLAATTWAGRSASPRARPTSSP